MTAHVNRIRKDADKIPLERDGGRILNGSRALAERRRDIAGSAVRTPITAWSTSVGVGAVQLKAFDDAVGDLQDAVAVGNHEVWGDALPAHLPGGAVQLRERLGARRRGADDPHAVAARGTAGPGGALPFAARIQESFGRHDVSGVRAHTDGAAASASAALGAVAYASGDHVAFGGAPDLHTAAHEAAHVVQQRAGVSLKDGVGESGDVYERHADAVADLVVRGESAEGLLDTMARGGGSAARAAGGRVGALQRKEGEGERGGAKGAPGGQDALFMTLLGTTSKGEAEMLVQMIADEGITPASIKAYIASQETDGWKQVWGLIKSGKWTFRDEGGREKLVFQLGAGSGSALRFSWDDAEVNVGKNEHGVGAQGRVGNVSGSAGVAADGESGGASVLVEGDGTTVSGKASGQTREGRGGKAEVTVENADGSRIDAEAEGGVNDGQGRGRVKVAGRDGAGNSGSGELEVHGENGAPVVKASGEGASGDVSARGSVEVSEAQVRTDGSLAYGIGDGVSITLSGHVSTAGGGGGSAAVVGPGGVTGEAGADHAEVGVGGRMLSVDKLSVGMKNLSVGELGGWLAGAGLSGTLTLAEDGSNAFSASGTLTLTEGESKIEVKLAGGSTNVTNPAWLDAFAVDAEGQVWGRGSVEFAALAGLSGSVSVTANEGGFQAEGKVEGSAGTEQGGKHSYSFEVAVTKSDELAGYAQAAYDYVRKTDAWSAGVHAMVRVEKNDSGWKALTELQARYGMVVGDGQTLTFHVSTSTDGRKIAWEVGVSWDWEKKFQLDFVVSGSEGEVGARVRASRGPAYVEIAGGSAAHAPEGAGPTEASTGDGSVRLNLGVEANFDGT